MGARYGLTNTLYVGAGVDGSLFGPLKALDVAVGDSRGDLLTGTRLDVMVPLLLGWRFDSGSDVSWIVEVQAGASVVGWLGNKLVDPELVGEAWRAMWLHRLEHHHPWIGQWLDHQRRDEYWRQGSVCEDYRAIRCPVYAIGGWADAYTNDVPRLLRYLTVPRKGLIGPWAHAFPHLAGPGPAIGFLQEALRWWDQWLKGIHTGIMDEPMLRAWIQEPVAPSACYDERPGRWVAEESWPSARIPLREFTLSPRRLGDAAEEACALSLSSPLTTGSASGRWCSFGQDPDLPGDQRGDDGGSLIFDTPPLPER